MLGAVCLPFQSAGKERPFMKCPMLHRPGIASIVFMLLISVGSETPAAVSSQRELKPASVGADAVSSRAKPALPYAEYVRLVSRRGVVGGGHTRKKVSKGAKVAKTVKKGVKGKAAALVVAARPASLPPVAAPAVVAKKDGSGSWSPSIAEVREVLRESRDLSGANLRGMNLAGFDLRKASLVNADLYLANLEGSRLDGANLRGASLEMANLRGATLREAKLSGAGLFMTNLEGADLKGADLSCVYAVGANLRGAALARANLRGGIFTNAVTEPGNSDAPLVAESDRDGDVTNANALRDVSHPDGDERFSALSF